MRCKWFLGLALRVPISLAQERRSGHLCWLLWNLSPAHLASLLLPAWPPTGAPGPLATGRSILLLGFPALVFSSRKQTRSSLTVGINIVAVLISI